MVRFICTLEIKNCDHKGESNACLLDKPGCGFRMQEIEETKEVNNQPFQKKKKWFEAYVK